MTQRRSGTVTIFDVAEIHTHGGSLRIYARHEQDEEILATVVEKHHASWTDPASGTRRMNRRRPIYKTWSDT